MGFRWGHEKCDCHRLVRIEAQLDQIIVLLQNAPSSGVGEKLGQIISAIQTTNTEVHAMAGELDALQAEVARNTDVDASAIALLTGLSAKIQALIDAGADPVKLQAFADSLKASSDSLAAAVTANTPAGP